MASILLAGKHLKAVFPEWPQEGIQCMIPAAERSGLPSNEKY